MSATGRGASRIEADFYPTPLDAFAPLLPYLPKDVAFWEPAMGDGRIVAWLGASDRIAGGDDLAVGGNFLDDLTRRQFIITNPPFSLAQEFCQHAIGLAPEVMMLLRLNFLASQKRKAWWQLYTPAALFVLSARPSFTPDGKTDATDYAWFYWGHRYAGIFHL